MSLSRDTWHKDHANIVTLFHWAIEQGEAEGFDYANLDYMIAKPWKYRTQFVLAYCSEADSERAKKIKLVQYS